jgi:DNA-binding transcriptional ArsR family regulator
LTRNRDSEERLIEALGNRARLKILLTLARSSTPLTIYKIGRQSGLGRSTINRNIGILVGAKLVARVLYGEIPLYALNLEEEDVKVLVNAFREMRLI